MAQLLPILPAAICMRLPQMKCLEGSAGGEHSGNNSLCQQATSLNGRPASGAVGLWLIHLVFRYQRIKKKTFCCSSFLPVTKQISARDLNSQAEAEDMHSWFYFMNTVTIDAFCLTLMKVPDKHQMEGLSELPDTKPLNGVNKPRGAHQHPRSCSPTVCLSKHNLNNLEQLQQGGLIHTNVALNRFTGLIQTCALVPTSNP